MVSKRVAMKVAWMDALLVVQWVPKMAVLTVDRMAEYKAV